MHLQTKGDICWFMQREVLCTHAKHLILSKKGRIDLRLCQVPGIPSEHDARPRLLVHRRRMSSLRNNHVLLCGIRSELSRLTPLALTSSSHFKRVLGNFRGKNYRHPVVSHVMH